MEELNNFRQKIDEYDIILLETLARRLKTVEKVKILKNNFLNSEELFLDPIREAEILQKNILFGELSGMPKALINTIWRGIISNANLHEQPSLRICYSSNLSDKMLLSLLNYYPLENVLLKFNAQEIGTAKFSNLSIICLHSEIDKNLVEGLIDSGYYIFNICETTNGERVLMFGKVKKFYKKIDAIFVMLNKEKDKIVFFDDKDYLKNAQVNSFIYLGSSAPII